MSAAEILQPSRRGVFAGLQPEPILTRIALVMGLSLLLTIPAFLLDGRMFQGENVWVKPIKFQLALAIYFGTLAVYAAFLPRGLLETPRLRFFLVVVGFATLAEMIWIGGAAMFATASHFNTTPLLYGVYLLMGAFAVLLTSASLVLGLAFWRDRGSALPEAVRLSLSLGLILTFALTLIVAGTLSARSGHFVGTPTQGAALPLLGWSREVGDLRVAHFFATHALHVVPLFGIAALTLRRDRPARILVWAGAGAFAAFTIFTFVQALSGRPFP
ncbi:MAG: hypothetical protein EP307_11565 [Rhodobacteraceae bacterium]|nr:MAG: hypothetical protein EP307_11565 [Paracoccaceae bacterium]